MLMSLGLFVFSLQTAPFTTIRRSTSQRWSENKRFGKRAATQFLGPGTDEITINGMIAPELTGTSANLDKLRRMAASGKAWILTQGDGKILGQWFIERVEETGKHYTRQGLPQKIDFTLSLKRYGEENPDQLGDLSDSYEHVN